MTREEYWFWLCSAPGFFRDEVRRLLTMCESPEEVYRMDKQIFVREHLITQQQRKDLEAAMDPKRIQAEKRKLEKAGIRFLCPDSPDFPARLRTIPEAPYGLYVKGNLPEDEKPAAGMVGSRLATVYGKKQARRFASALASHGVQVISGMAAGIDGESARGALAAGSRTFAVLGCGVDVIYPLENMDLYYDILASGGGLISEYAPGTQPVAWQFPFRNRLISGLSDCLLVLEAKVRSGSLITVRYALEQGREVYALPGRLIDKTSEGCNRMIADGAGILLDPDSLLAEILPQAKAETGQERAPVRLPEAYRGTRIEKIFESMGEDPESVYTIVEKIHESPENAMAALCEMELLGMVREVAKNVYVKSFPLDMGF